MSHAEKADKLLIKPAAGARPAPPRTRGQFIPKARHTAASHPTSHTRHGDNQADNSHRQTNPASLTVTRRGKGLRDRDAVRCGREALVACFPKAQRS
jgi:hypothetical protein